MKYYLSAACLICLLLTQCKKDNVAARVTDNAEFLDYTLDGVSFHFDPVTDTFTVTTQPIYGTALTSAYISCFRRGPGTPGYIVLSCAQAGPVTGVYPSSNPFSADVYNIPPGAVQVTETSYAATTGEFFEGSFTGSFIDSGIAHSITGSFRAKRNY